MKRLLLPIALIAATAALTAALSGCAPEPAVGTHVPTPTPTPTKTVPGPALPAALSPSQIAALPATVYDAVIPGLLPAPTDPHFSTANTVAFDTAVYAADFATPVARIPAKDFLGKPTVIVPVATKGEWTQVLTASRQVLPSQAPAGTSAPAQTSAWTPTSALKPLRDLPNRVVVSVSAQTLTITDAKGGTVKSFPVGVGTPDTPTPTGVTGYLQARYLDPAQDQTVHRIQLTSIHATGRDEPYGGSDGGLIGVHYQATASGAVSHGCIRLSADAIAAVDKLALGTPVTIVD